MQSPLNLAVVGKHGSEGLVSEPSTLLGPDDSSPVNELDTDLRQRRSGRDHGVLCGDNGLRSQQQFNLPVEEIVIPYI